MSQSAVNAEEMMERGNSAAGSSSGATFQAEFDFCCDEGSNIGVMADAVFHNFGNIKVSLVQRVQVVVREDQVGYSKCRSSHFLGPDRVFLVGGWLPNGRAGHTL